MLGSIKTKLSPLTSTQSETESENGRLFFGPSNYVHILSIGHFHHFHFLKTICYHNLEQEQVKPCPEGSEGLPCQTLKRSRFPCCVFFILRYESSTLILYKELSSTIFQSRESVSQTSVTPVQISTLCNI